MEPGCCRWRWHPKAWSHRLSQVHGDFYPWNVLFQEVDTEKESPQRGGQRLLARLRALGFLKP